MVTGLNIIGSNKALQDHEIKRFVAALVDWIIVLVVSTIIAAILFASAFAVGGFGTLFWGIGLLAWALIAILYWAVQEAFTGATIGKKLMGLQVVGTTGPMDLVKALIRNVTKFHGLLLVIDWFVGLAMEGDPRQKMTDRFAGTTVVRTDAQAYMEEQFRQMATPPPHPMAPPQGYVPPAWGAPQTPPPQQSAVWQQPVTNPQQPAQAQAHQAPPAQTVPPGGWPQQQQPAPAAQPGAAWPQHQWNEQGQLVQPRFCSNCGGSLVPRGDGRNVCTRCGTVY
jgi:uncharacterized RDD family membrane protein YckC/ribosomal protein S27AE